MGMDPYKVFRRPLITEKSVDQKEKFRGREHGDSFVKYTVEVDVNATKVDIRAAMERLFPESEGQILKINTMRKPGKRIDPDQGRRYRRYRPGRSAAQKKAVITLRGDVTIPMLEGA